MVGRRWPQGPSISRLTCSLKRYLHVTGDRATSNSNHIPDDTRYHAGHELCAIICGVAAIVMRNPGQQELSGDQDWHLWNPAEPIHAFLGLRNIQGNPPSRNGRRAMPSGPKLAARTRSFGFNVVETTCTPASKRAPG